MNRTSILSPSWGFNSGNGLKRSLGKLSLEAASSRLIVLKDGTGLTLNEKLQEFLFSNFPPRNVIEITDI